MEEEKVESPEFVYPFGYYIKDTELGLIYPNQEQPYENLKKKVTVM